MNPMQELINRCDMATGFDDYASIRAALPAARAYAERMEFLEAALRESTYYIPEGGVCSRKHPAYYRWLGEGESNDES